MLSDLINAEVANVAFGVDQNYQWQLLDLIMQATKWFLMLQKNDG